MRLLTPSTFRLAAATAVLLCAAACDASARPSDRATIIDGDTLDLNAERIRLFGVDAPERGQICTNSEGPYNCGQAAAQALSDRVGQRPVQCDPIEQDRYQRTVAVCRVDGEDLGAWMVRQGSVSPNLIADREPRA